MARGGEGARGGDIDREVDTRCRENAFGVSLVYAGALGRVRAGVAGDNVDRTWPTAGR
jgi:hypothetical protein